jgi:hypothetical protein
LATSRAILAASSFRFVSLLCEVGLVSHEPLILVEEVVHLPELPLGCGSLRRLGGPLGLAKELPEGPAREETMKSLSLFSEVAGKLDEKLKDLPSADALQPGR